jgi:Tol biopolymer transport system component
VVGDLRQIVVQEFEDGHPVVIATAAEAGNLRWSPDGSELLFFARDNDAGGLFIVSSSGGVPRRIVGGLFVACWSPDGKRIAVAHHLSGRVLLVDAAGHAEKSISIAGAQRWISDLDWSPATNRLLVAGNDVGGRYTVWTIRADGTGQQAVIADQTEISSARWTARGDAIYYFRRDGQTVTLAKVSAASTRASTPEVLLTGLEADGSFAVSADGARLVYARAPFYSNLYLVDSPTSSTQALATRQLTHGTSRVERPSVSPDGTRILFSVGHAGRANLYTIPIGGGEMTPVTFFESFSVGGAWSPDGDSIAFGSTEGGTPRVWLVRAAGGTPQPVSSGAFSDSFDVRWSPSREILYQQAGNRNYYAFDVATGREQPFLSDASLGWIFFPMSSPDRTRIAFGWSRQSASGLWVRDTRDVSQRLVYGPSIPTPIGWSPDGSSIYAYEGRRAAYRGVATPLGETSTDVTILKVSATGGATTVVRLPFEEVGGITMTPDGSTFVCSVYSSRSDVWIVEHFDAEVEY